MPQEKLGDFADARAGYAAVIPTDNWYAALASARLDRKFVPTLQPLPLSDAGIQQLGAEPGFVRTRELLLAAMEPEASLEWRAAFDELAPDRQVQAIGLAARWGWHHQAIATAARQKLFNDYDLLYPRPFDGDVRAASRRTGLPESLIYAIIRQESLYRADAGSSAGALGLMQLLPETARLTARRVDLPAPSRAQLLQPAVNIPLGSSFLAYMLHRFDGETALAAAAYNAGPNAARRWLPRHRWTSTCGPRTSRSTKPARTCSALPGTRSCSRGSTSAPRRTSRPGCAASARRRLPQRARADRHGALRRSAPLREELVDRRAGRPATGGPHGRRFGLREPAAQPGQSLQHVAVVQVHQRRKRRGTIQRQLPRNPVEHVRDGPLAARQADGWRAEVTARRFAHDREVRDRRGPRKSRRAPSSCPA